MPRNLLIFHVARMAKNAGLARLRYTAGTRVVSCKLAGGVAVRQWREEWDAL